MSEHRRFLWGSLGKQGHGLPSACHPSSIGRHAPSTVWITNIEYCRRWPNIRQGELDDVVKAGALARLIREAHCLYGKIKVLNENLDELRQVAQDALEDGILMGCCERQLRDALAEAVGHLVNPYSGTLPDNNVIGKSPC